MQDELDSGTNQGQRTQERNMEKSKTSESERVHK